MRPPRPWEANEVSAALFMTLSWMGVIGYRLSLFSASRWSFFGFTGTVPAWQSARSVVYSAVFVPGIPGALFLNF